MADEISTQEASEIVGVTGQTIRDWCTLDLIKHRRVGRQKVYMIDREDLIRYARELGYLPQHDREE